MIHTMKHICLCSRLKIKTLRKILCFAKACPSVAANPNPEASMYPF